MKFNFINALYKQLHCYVLKTMLNNLNAELKLLENFTLVFSHIDGRNILFAVTLKLLAIVWNDGQ